MASALFGKGREGFGAGSLNWATDDVRVIFVDSADYTLDIDVHNALDDVAAAGRVAVSAASIQNKTNTLGVMDGDDITINSVSGDQFEGLILYKHTGVESTSLLIAWIDSYTGLPCTPNGGNITVSWPGDANKIFKL
jgi:hypothetical protein